MKKSHLRLAPALTQPYLHAGTAAAADPAANGSVATGAQAGTNKASSGPADSAAVREGRRWSAKVLLMGGVPEGTLTNDSDTRFVHPIHTPFLIGKRPRGELLLLGGRWDPQDGAPPTEVRSASCLGTKTG